MTLLTSTCSSAPAYAADPPDIKYEVQCLMGNRIVKIENVRTVKYMIDEIYIWTNAGYLHRFSRNVQCYQYPLELKEEKDDATL